MRKLAVRLALRVEGNLWNAYVASPHTMEGAMLIGSILKAPAENDPLVKEGFMTLMALVMNNAIEAMTGERPETVVVEPAPEGEKSGNA